MRIEEKYLIDYQKLMLKLKAFSFYHSFLRRFGCSRERETHFFFWSYFLFFDVQMKQRLWGLGEKSVLPIGPAKTQGKQICLLSKQREKEAKAQAKGGAFIYITKTFSCLAKLRLH